jgi:hypothetical protein
MRSETGTAGRVCGLSEREESATSLNPMRPGAAVSLSEIPGKFGPCFVAWMPIPADGERVSADHRLKPGSLCLR